MIRIPLHAHGIRHGGRWFFGGRGGGGRSDSAIVITIPKGACDGVRTRRIEMGMIGAKGFELSDYAIVSNSGYGKQ